MPRRTKKDNFIKKSLKQASKWFGRRFQLAMGRRRSSTRAGFVLPTVTMVALVVVLLTTAIMLRSFDRTKNASNYRVNQVTLSAAEPALARAQKKLDRLFSSPDTRGTPSEGTLDDQLTKNLAEYTLPDEERLQITLNNVPDQNARANSVNAWRFPVDTDNNGSFDSFTLYSILFYTPDRDNNGDFSWDRTPVEARTPPQDDGAVGNQCPGATATSAALVGASDWYESQGRLKKPFFTYVATVPITDTTGLGTGYEIYSGNKGFSALEYQQDRSVLPPSNNAVYYEDDLDIFSGPDFRINGRVFTNSNLFVSELEFKDAGDLGFYQVSSRRSCFYLAENSKIVVAGNLSYRDVTADDKGSKNATIPIASGDDTDTQGVIRLDLYQDPGQNYNQDPLTRGLNDGDKSIVDTQYSSDLAYNTQAYEARIVAMVEAATGALPDEVEDKKAELLAQDNPPTSDEAQRQALEIYFRNRTRRVPYKEVPPGRTTPTGVTPPVTVTLQGSGNTLRPPDEWMYPYQVDGDGSSSLGYATVSGGQNNLKILLKESSPGLIAPAATDPDSLSDGEEELLGDRVLLGHGLPANWYDPSEADFANQDAEQDITGSSWDSPNSAGTRYRKTRSEPLRDLDVAARDGFWERKARERAATPAEQEDGTGGVRIVTGAGVYLPEDDTTIATASKVVWPDTMPQPPVSATEHPYDNKIYYNDSGTSENIQAATAKRPYLQMRATAVYHYLGPSSGADPIACVSSFYDPTNIDTARNRQALDDVSGWLGAGHEDKNGFQELRIGNSTLSTGKIIANVANSNNGITYDYTGKAGNTKLSYQANLVYPNGRLVNPLLQKAEVVSGGTFAGSSITPALKSAVDSTSCALAILEGTASQAPSIIPHGTIQEVAFLNARQVKSINDDNDPANQPGYDPTASDLFLFPTNAPANEQIPELKTEIEEQYQLPIEARQPLEIRATVIDLGQLLQAAEVGGEKLIPNSGIVYASRNDALPDMTAKQLKVSASDFKLDPTRRPNGILLINGEEVNRSDIYDANKKGFILASNLPVYVKGDFNLHRSPSSTASTNEIEEFETKLNQKTWNNIYGRSDFNKQFACRASDDRLPDCTTGDSWRASTVISDAMTLLSDNFRFGFRNEGGYDLRNNRIDSVEDPYDTITAGFNDTDDTNNIDSASDVAIKRRAQGFLTNDFVVNGLSSGAFTFDKDSIRSGFPGINITPYDYTYSRRGIDSDSFDNAINSSYFNNMVTPIQRRGYSGQFDEYVMEFCLKLPVSECEVNDWVVNDAGVKASDLIDVTSSRSTLESGTTATPPVRKYLGFPRRVAFKRNTTSNELTDSSNAPITLGGSARPIPLGMLGDTVTASGDYSNADNALWYRKTNDTGNNASNLGSVRYDNYNVSKQLDYLEAVSGTAQPVLVPILQIQVTSERPSNKTFSELRDSSSLAEDGTQWIARATDDVTVNMVMATGDTPSRPEVSASNLKASLNGGLGNLPHFIENWEKDSKATNISGSFIQLKRSEYATAPWWSLLDISPGLTAAPFNYDQKYKTNISNSKITYFAPPTRNWGFDVGLLSQPPDLFSKQFASNFSDDPNEFFREVSRDDEWVEALLCSQVIAPTSTAGNITTTGNAVNTDQRPGNCP